MSAARGRLRSARATSGFPVNPEIRVVDTIDEVVAFCRHWQDHRHDLAYEIDGVVIKVADLGRRDDLGLARPGRRGGPSPTSSRPRSARPALLDIRVSVGRTGRTTPYAVLEPVFVGGANVERATLHNQDQVKVKDVRPGDTVIVRRAGDVIPEVVGPVLAARPKGLPEWEFPTTCPCPVRVDAGAARGRVRHPLRPSRVSVPASRGRSSTSPAGAAWTSRGSGERTVAQFLDLGLLHDIASVYEIDFDRVLELEGYGQTSVDNLRAAIEESKQRPLANLLVGLNIRHLGPAGAEALAAPLRAPRRHRARPPLARRRRAAHRRGRRRRPDHRPAVTRGSARTPTAPCSTGCGRPA